MDEALLNKAHHKFLAKKSKIILILAVQFTVKGAKIECFSFKSGGAMQIVKRLKED